MGPPECPVCGRDMKPLFTSFFCEMDHDRAPVAVDPETEKTQPIVWPSLFKNNQVVGGIVVGRLLGGHDPGWTDDTGDADTTVEGLTFTWYEP